MDIRTQAGLERIGPRSLAVVGSAPSWERSAWAAMVDVEGRRFVAGRTGGRLHGLDGFVGDQIEALVTRKKRGIEPPFLVCSTNLPLTLEHTVVINGIRCLTAEHLILDSPFRSGRSEAHHRTAGSARAA